MKIVTRAGWGARPARCSSSHSAIKSIVVHYSGSDADEQDNHANCAARVRAIQNFHMSPGWSGLPQGGCDIAYNFLFCRHGYIFVGRGWNNQSGATGNANPFTIAICFLGNDTANRDDVTRAGKRALAEFLEVATKDRFPGASITGHRDWMSTSCPGDQLYKFVTTDAWKSWTKRVRYELWVGKERLKRSVWVRPGDNRVGKLFNSFYGNVKKTVQNQTNKGRTPRFRRRNRN